jgi:hypothetical protein
MWNPPSRQGNMTPSASSGAGAGSAAGATAGFSGSAFTVISPDSHLQIGFQEPLAGIEAGLLLALHDWLHEHPAFYYFGPRLLLLRVVYY